MIVTLISLGDRARRTEPGCAKLGRLTYAVPDVGRATSNARPAGEARFSTRRLGWSTSLSALRANRHTYEIRSEAFAVVNSAC
jgi:hypothetical protein